MMYVHELRCAARREGSTASLPEGVKLVMGRHIGKIQQSTEGLATPFICSNKVAGLQYIVFLQLPVGR